MDPGALFREVYQYTKACTLRYSSLVTSRRSHGAPDKKNTCTMTGTCLGTKRAIQYFIRRILTEQISHFIDEITKTPND